jgi:hypothetical protein
MIRVSPADGISDRISRTPLPLTLHGHGRALQTVLWAAGCAIRPDAQSATETLPPVHDLWDSVQQRLYPRHELIYRSW